MRKQPLLDLITMGVSGVFGTMMTFAGGTIVNRTASIDNLNTIAEL